MTKSELLLLLADIPDDTVVLVGYDQVMEVTAVRLGRGTAFQCRRCQAICCDPWCWCKDRDEPNETDFSEVATVVISCDPVRT